mmetsp:Transcript_15887/g.48442  ORF Transcript_15887/g.48442 Transcript_15887/m.48442 type:complete len:252 (+) Transcript_15887:374-1129(+)
MGAPTKGGAGEIDLGAMGGNPSVGGEISTAPTGKTDDEIFTEFGVATPQVKRTERKEEMQREFQQRADAVTQSDGNFITNLPAGLQVGIERVLLATLLGLGTVFILDGILITWDAFVISSKKELVRVRSDSRSHETRSLIQIAPLSPAHANVARHTNRAPPSPALRRSPSRCSRRSSSRSSATPSCLASSSTFSSALRRRLTRRTKRPPQGLLALCCLLICLSRFGGGVTVLAAWHDLARRCFPTAVMTGF